jgi:putative tryptophan/tyrosine transport system substrate-binding protein
MRRREFLGVLTGAATWPVAASAQTLGRSYRLAYLRAVSRRTPTFAAVLDELRLAGFIEGQNLTVLDDDRFFRLNRR